MAAFRTGRWWLGLRLGRSSGAAVWRLAQRPCRVGLEAEQLEFRVLAVRPFLVDARRNFDSFGSAAIARTDRPNSALAPLPRHGRRNPSSVVLPADLCPSAAPIPVANLRRCHGGAEPPCRTPCNASTAKSTALGWARPSQRELIDAIVHLAAAQEIQSRPRRRLRRVPG